MVEGEAGLLSVFPREQRPKYEPSKRQITFRNGAIATTYSSEEPDLLRGPAHDLAWLDELASFYDADTDETSGEGDQGTTWSNLQFGLRLGPNPQQLVTTTPKPLKLLKSLLLASTTTVTRGTTYENRTNLSEAFYTEIISKYEGSRLGRQELLAEILEDVEGALFNRQWLDATRLDPASIRPRDLQRIVVAIDPAVTNRESSDDTGIIVTALGVDGRGIVLDDLTCKMSPDGWASRAVQAYHQYKADRIIAEVNNGGDLVERVIRTVDQKVSYRAVNASRGKITRAEPVAALYEQGRISMAGSFPALEDELCGYTGKPGERSPNRLDALVWGISELMLTEHAKPRAMWI